MKTSELSGAALDWAVAKCERPNLHPEGTRHKVPKYSTNWSQCGPILDREKIAVWVDDDLEFSSGEWIAHIAKLTEFYTGSTPLIAVMRCYVASRLGDEVDIPEELS